MEELINKVTENHIMTLIKLQKKGIGCKDVALTVRSLKATLKFNKAALADSQTLMNSEILHALRNTTDQLLEISENLKISLEDVREKFKNALENHHHPIAIAYTQERQALREIDEGHGIFLD